MLHRRSKIHHMKLSAYSIPVLKICIYMQIAINPLSL